MTGTCSQCFYGQGFLTSAGIVRLCRFNAPPTVVQNSNAGLAHLWPQVQDTDWCGQGIYVSTGVPFTQTTPQFTVVAKLPTATPQIAGMRLFITDAVSTHPVGTSLTGGGSITMPVYCSGAAWLAG